MPPRQSAANQAAFLEKIDQKLGAFITVMEEHADQTDETLESVRQEIKDLADSIRILTTAIDDIRCEIEWSLRHVVPPRAPAIGLPVTSVPKIRTLSRDGIVPQPAEGSVGDQAGSEPGRLF